MHRSARVVTAATTICLLILIALAPAHASAPDISLLVTFVPEADAEPVLDAARGVGARVVDRLGPLPIYRLACSQADAEAILGKLRVSDEVRGAEFEGEQFIQVVPNDSLYRAFQWNLRR